MMDDVSLTVSSEASVNKLKDCVQFKRSHAMVHPISNVRLTPHS